MKMLEQNEISLVPISQNRPISRNQGMFFLLFSRGVLLLGCCRVSIVLASYHRHYLGYHVPQQLAGQV